MMMSTTPTSYIKSVVDVPYIQIVSGIHSEELPLAKLYCPGMSINL